MSISGKDGVVGIQSAIYAENNFFRVSQAPVSHLTNLSNA